MVNKIKSFLFSLDFMGLHPNLRILNYDNYKSIFSSYFSILIILISIAFSIYSFIDYSNQNPAISYFKTVDNSINKTIKMSDTFKMFNISTMCPVKYFIDAFYMTTHRDEIIEVEPCELGKNLDLKFKDLIENIEKTENISINNYKCLNLNNKDITLFQNNIDPDNKMDFFTLSIYILNLTNCPFERYIIDVITENDLINHENKNNPIIPYYRMDSFRNYETNKVLSLKYDFQYIKYESDDGLFFQKNNIRNGISFSGISYGNNNNIYGSGFFLFFNINKANYDLYKRSYKRIQSLLSEITSVVNILIGVGKFLLNYLLDKKMSVDIVEYILSNSKFKQKNDYSPKEKIKSNSTIQNIESNNCEKKNIISKSISLNTKKNVTFNNINSIKHVNRVGKKIGFFDIMKSYLFCRGCRDYKTKLLDICYEYILEEFCIERILRRLYKLEKCNKKIYRKQNNFKMQKTLHYIDCINNKSNNLNMKNHLISQIINNNK